MKKLAWFTLLVVLPSGCITKSEESGRTDGNSKQPGLAEPVLTKEEIIAAIKKNGGRVTVDESSPHKPVIAVMFHGHNFNDAKLVHLKKMTGLQSLELFNTYVSDAGLVHLKGLTNLRSLTLANPGITDAGLVPLKGLMNLRYLSLQATSITDKGLMHLTGLTGLRLLDLTWVQVTDAGAMKLQAALPNCRILR